MKKNLATVLALILLGHNSSALAQASAPIDGSLLDLIDQNAATYFNPAWNLNINQFKAWLATIAFGEGGYGGYGAHSQYGGGYTGDAFDHIAVPGGSVFRFSTGLGPFQLDRGSSEQWDQWTSIRKLTPQEAVISAARWHTNFGAGATLGTFSINSRWNAVDTVAPYTAGDYWPLVTGTSWAAHSGGNVALDWPTIKSQLAANALAYPRLSYSMNVVDLGSLKWNITSGANLITDSGRAVIFDGNYETYIVTARDWNGSEVCRYYYAYRTDLGPYPIEMWAWANDSRYVFARECNGPFPEGRSGSHAGYPALASPAVTNLLAAPTLVWPGNSTSPGPTISGTIQVFYWSQVTNAMGYVLQLQNLTAGTGIESWRISSGSTGFVWPTALIAGHGYQWNVYAYNDTVSGPLSTTYYFTIQGTSSTSNTITAMEYYIDGPDPGVGNATPILPLDGSYNGSTEIGQATTNNLPLGPHKVFVRARSSNGTWGTYPPQLVNVSLSTAVVARAECYIDTAPGPGYGIPLAAEDGAFNSKNEAVTASLSTSGLAVGNHTLYIRAQSSAGVWGPARATPIEVLPGSAGWVVSAAQCGLGLLTDTAPTLVTYGMQAVDGAFDDAVEDLVFTGTAPSTVGNYRVFVRGKNGQATWGPWASDATFQVVPVEQSPGVRTNQFGFTILGSSGLTIIVEACTNVANPVWTPVQTNTLTGDTLYFSDPQWPNHRARFYRLRWP